MQVLGKPAKKMVGKQRVNLGGGLVLPGGRKDQHRYIA